MTNYIDNSIIKVGVKSFGATLTSIVSKKADMSFYGKAIRRCGTVSPLFCFQ